MVPITEISAVKKENPLLDGSDLVDKCHQNRKSLV